MISSVDEDGKEGELQVARWKETEVRNSLVSAKPTLIHSQILAQLDSIAKIVAYVSIFKIWTFALEITNSQGVYQSARSWPDIGGDLPLVQLLRREIHPLLVRAWRGSLSLSFSFPVSLREARGYAQATVADGTLIQLIH